MDVRGEPGRQISLTAGDSFREELAKRDCPHVYSKENLRPHRQRLHLWAEAQRATGVDYDG